MIVPWSMVPFLSSIVTVSFAHFIRNLTSFILIDGYPRELNELLYGPRHCGYRAGGLSWFRDRCWCCKNIFAPMVTTTYHATASLFLRRFSRFRRMHIRVLLATSN